MDFRSDLRPKQASIEAQIIRADGTVEELGTVDYYHRSLFMRLWFRLWKRLGGRGRFWK